MIGRTVSISLSVCILFMSLISCSKEKAPARAETAAEGFSIAVFVPGVVTGSPLYEQLVAGANRAAAEARAVVKVLEGGFNQGEWQDSVTALAATGGYDLILTSNPLMPQLCGQVSAQYPDQKFAVLDGYLEGNGSIYTLLYNQMEQAYLIGHLGGLITTSNELPGSTPELSVGLIAGQEYPIMNQVIRVGFELGLTAVDPGIALDFRVIGNWYDASRGSQLAAGMFDQGTDIVLAIAGGANQGVISEAQKRGRYVLWFDSNGFSEAPGTVLGSSLLDQERAAYETVKAAITGALPFGTAVVKGVKDGYVEFIEDDPLYIEHVPERIRERQSEAVRSIKAGDLVLPMPTL